MSFPPLRRRRAPRPHWPLFNGSDPNGTWSLYVVDDASGDAGSIDGGWCVTVTVDPISDAGGPYQVAEGEVLTLDGSGSTPGGTYGWDLNGDNDFTDATGVAPTLRWAQLEALGIDDGPASVTVALLVTVDSRFATDSADLDVSNTAPISVIAGNLTATVGVPFTLKVGAADPSSADTAAAFEYTVDWGDGSALESVTGPADPPVTHTYTDTGAVTASFTATDKDGGVGEPTLVQVQVDPAAPPSTTSSYPETTPPPPTSTAITSTATSATAVFVATSTSFYPAKSTSLLAVTGIDIGSRIVVGVLLVMSGFAVMLMARRRRVGPPTH